MSTANQDHYRTHLTNEDVRKMRTAYAGGASAEDLAERYQITPSAVLSICIGRRFKKAGGPITSRKPRKLSDWEAVWIRVVAADFSDESLATEFGVGRDMVKRIRLGINYEWLDDHLPKVRRRR